MVAATESPPIEDPRNRIASSFDRVFYTPDDCLDLDSFQQLPEEHAEAIRKTDD